MNITDLADPLGLARILHGMGWHVDVDTAAALASDACTFTEPPAGAWTVLARVAEHRGDYVGFERWTTTALAADVTSPWSLADEAWLAALGEGCGRKVGTARRADHLFTKLERWCGRTPQLPDQLALCGEILGAAVDAPTPTSLAVAEAGPFASFLLFEGGLLDRFLAVAGDRLPAAERALAESWRGARHRHVRMVEQRRRRWTLEDVGTGERLLADTLIETWWVDGREAFVLVLPVGSRLAVVGEPVLFPPARRAEARAAMADPDPRAVARIALGWCAAVHRAARVAFCFPGADPEAVPDDELALLELVRAHRGTRTRDVAEEADVLLDAIVAHRIITRRTLDTWERAASLLAAGVARDEAWAIVRADVLEELAARAEAEDAA